MDSKQPNPATKIIETGPGSTARRGKPGEAARPHVFRRKIDCDGRPSVSDRRPEVRGARSTNREQRFIY